jgi:pyruvate,water dikinase
MTTDELKDAANNPSSTVRSTASQRRADYERWEHLAPPPFVGAPPDPSQIPPEMQPLLHLFFGVGEPVLEGRQLKGQGASKGVVRGRARVIKDLSDSARLQKGEILVCATTAPPWTPLFAVAAAVVTDSGGILSHSAICAREYAIPCVVATQIATSAIQDGAMVVVDGSKGTVEIES